MSWDKCIICQTNEPTRCNNVCTDEACKITKKLFVWEVWLDEGSRTPKGFSKGSGSKIYCGDGIKKPWQNVYHWKQDRKLINEKLKQVRAKLFLLSHIDNLDSIIKTLDTNYCNQPRYKINRYSYENTRIFNTR